MKKLHGLLDFSVRAVFLLCLCKNRNGGRHQNRPPSKSIWQAWRSPASLRARPLSLPSACGCHEIDHLKYLSYPMFRIPHLSLFVKYLTLTQKTAEAFLADAPHRDNRVFVFFQITGNFQPQNNFCITSYS